MKEQEALIIATQKKLADKKKNKVNGHAVLLSEIMPADQNENDDFFSNFMDEGNNNDGRVAERDGDEDDRDNYDDSDGPVEPLRKKKKKTSSFQRNSPPKNKIKQRVTTGFEKKIYKVLNKLQKDVEEIKSGTKEQTVDLEATHNIKLPIRKFNQLELLEKKLTRDKVCRIDTVSISWHA